MQIQCICIDDVHITHLACKSVQVCRMVPERFLPQAKHLMLTWSRTNTLTHVPASTLCICLAGCRPGLHPCMSSDWETEHTDCCMRHLRLLCRPPSPAHPRGLCSSRIARASVAARARRCFLRRRPSASAFRTRCPRPWLCQCQAQLHTDKTPNLDLQLQKSQWFPHCTVGSLAVVGSCN